MARLVGTDKRACLVRLQKAHAPTATVTLLTSIIEISPLYTSGPMVLTNGRVGSHKPFFSIAKGKKVSSNERNKIMNMFSDTKKTAKRAVSVAKGRAYEDLYQHLSTKEGEDIYRMARVREKDNGLQPS